MGSLLFKAALLLVAAKNVLHACSCGGFPTICESLSTSGVAFVGTVKRGTEPETNDETPGGFGVRARPAIVAVETIVRGLPENTREVHVASMFGTSCYFPLQAGERWLIFGGMRAEPPRAGSLLTVATGGCSGSRTIDAEDRDGILRMVASFLPGAPNLVLGTVREYKGWNTKWRTDNLVKGAEVTLTLSGASPPARAPAQWTSKSGDKGTFEAESLDPGEYSFQVTNPGFAGHLNPVKAYEDFGPALPARVNVPVRGCIDLQVQLRPDVRISGTLRSAVDGKPVPNIKVSAFEVREPGDGDGDSRRMVNSAMTGNDGRYTIPMLPAGKYWIGINAESGRDRSEFATTFHPSSPSEAGAAIVTVQNAVESGASTVLEKVDITVPPARRPVEVRVRVVWAGDGERPAEDVSVDAIHPENGRLSPATLKEPYGQYTKANGYTTLRLWEGTEYTLHGVWQKMEARPLAGIPRPSSSRTEAWHVTNRLRILAAPEAEFTLVLEKEPTPIGKAFGHQ
jgi:hypothetical protein